ncbi:MAG: DUF11 domain-containing protein [Oscillospiraceae bacterium]|nr:DUF11 domain-containing protein [Oscillospiraceae bacterium]
MKKMQKVMVCLAILMLLACSLSAAVSASSNTQDGIRVDILTAKDTYAANEDIEFHITVTNTNNFTVKNISVSALLPEGLTLKSGPLSKQFVNLAANGVETLTVIAVLEEQPGSSETGDTSPSDTGGSASSSTGSATASGSGDTAGSETGSSASFLTGETTTSKAGSSTSTTKSTTAGGVVITNPSVPLAPGLYTPTPQTGDSLRYGMLFPLILLFSLIGITLTLRFHIKAKRAISLVLCLCVMAGALGFFQFSDSLAADPPSFESEHTITAGGNSYTLTVTVAYNALPVFAINLTVSQDEFLTSGRSEPVYFYAEYPDGAGSILLMSDNDTVMAEMKDDGVYGTSGDDIENDGIYSCILMIDLSEENILYFYAVVTDDDGIRSDMVVIYIISAFTDSELADIQSVDDAIAALLASGEYIAADTETRKAMAEELLNQLAEEGLILAESLFYDEDAEIFTFEYKCGMLGGLILEDFDGCDGPEDTGDDLPVLGDPPLPPPDNGGSGIESAVILNAFEDTPYRREMYAQPKADWEDRGLATTLITAVTVPVIKDLKGYDIIWFAGHGVFIKYISAGVYTNDPLWLLNEELSGAADKSYSIDLKQQRLLHVNGATYAMLPSLISASYNQMDLHNSFVTFSSCQIMGSKGNISDSMANAFLNCSVRGFAAYHNTVFSDYSYGFMKTYLDNLIQSESTLSAFTSSLIEHGNNDIEWLKKEYLSGNLNISPLNYARLLVEHLPAYPCFRGDTAAKLVESTLQNGSFELSSTPVRWKTFADVRVITQLGDLNPTHGSRMAMLSTGIGAAKEDYIASFAGATQGSILQQTIKLSDDVDTLSFDYNMVSEEPPEYVGSQFDDTFVAEILDVNGTLLKQIVYMSVNTADWLPASGFKLTIGKDSGRPAWQTSWQSVSVDLTPYRNQIITLRFLVFDRGDSAFDSAALIDNVAIK